MTNFKVILDTNVLLVSIAKTSKYRPIFDSLINGKFQLVITNEILSEYVEIIERKTNAIISHNIAEFLIKSPNVEKIEVSYKWNLIEQDYDDNKFADAAIAGQTKYIITNDKHFAILNDTPFPKVDTIKIDDFLDLLAKN
jgi:putative PIN family toxin of toxin-antitoxin system